MKWLLPIPLVLAAACSAAQPEPSATWFVESPPDEQPEFQHSSGLDGSFFLPEIIGSGGALFDHDADGDLDLYLVTSGSHGPDAGGPDAANRLFSRDADGRWIDRSESSGLGDRGYGMGVALGDIDNDGDLDLFVTNLGRDTLYRNQGDGTFVDITEAAQVGGRAWSTSAGFCDFNADGFLDLFVVTYVSLETERRCQDPGGQAEYCKPTAYTAVPDALYRNDGDGTFTDVSGSAGVAAVASKGLGLACADFDRDGDQDVFVANDGESNDLWLNRGDGTFEERGMAAGAAVNAFGEAEASMGVALGDVDADLRLDLFVTHLTGETNTLYSGLARGGFQDRTALAGLGPPGRPYTGFGTALFDADHDGDLDLALVNGRVTRRAPRPEIADPGWSPTAESYREDYGEPDLLLTNDGSGRFSDACEHAPELCGPEQVGRGLIVGDVDGDGDLDLVRTDSNAPTRVLLNQAGARGTWLQVQAIDPRRMRDAIGAVVTVRAGDRAWARPVTHIQGYLASGEATTHFGLGSTTAVDEINIIWPDGIEETFEGVPTRQRIVLRRGSGRPLQETE